MDKQPDVPKADAQPTDDTAPDEASSDDGTTTAEISEKPAEPPRPPATPQRIPPRDTGPQRPSDPVRLQTAQRPIAPQARPQRVGPAAPQTPDKTGGGKWWAALAAAVVVIAAVAVGGYLFLNRDTAGDSSDALIRTEIGSFTQALATGDLVTLRTASCGELAEFYRNIPDAEFADVHRVAVEQGNIPVVQSVDAVQVTDDTAIAQVIAYTAANPNDRSPRTFDLRLEGESWKICSPE